MALIVQKYGGTSVGSIERIEAVAEKVLNYKQQGHDLVVVVSAMSGETNRLVDLAHQISPNPSVREYDVLVSTGEQVTIALLSMAFEKRGQAARSYTGSQVHILTDNAHSKARIREIDGTKINVSRIPIHVSTIVLHGGTIGQSVVPALPRIFEWCSRRHRPADWAPVDFYPIRWK